MTPKSSEFQPKHEVDELALLFEISQILDRSVDLSAEMGAILKTLAHATGMQRGTVTLLNRKSDEISIEAAHGLTRKQQEKTRYTKGEGITGRVIESGRPMIIPNIADEPLFLDRTGSADEFLKDTTAFICVPVKIGKETVGALSANRLFQHDVELEEDLRMLTIIASMIANAVRLRQAALEEQERLRDENERLQRELQDRFRPDNIIGSSSSMQEVYDQIGQVAPSDTTALIRGESGVGKELVAQAIHFNSPRVNRPFIKVNLAAIPENLVESELFGHEKGAFTGAVQQRKGRFEQANGGTIFLDEIGDISPAIQVSLLRVLQEREFERVGGAQTIKVDVRVITATNRDLEQAIEENAFRQDLYYRLNVFPILIPPLSERKADILDLANHFVEKYSQQHHKNVRRISTPAIDMLSSYHWPGNVRELENCIERAVLLTKDDVVHGHHLPPTLQTAESSGTVHEDTLDATLDRIESEMIIEVLKRTRGNKARAARELGLTERVMGLRVEKHKIDPRKYRAPRLG